MSVSTLLEKILPVSNDDRLPLSSIASRGQNFQLSAFLLITQKIPPCSVTITAHNPNRIDGSRASSVVMPKPCRATTIAPSRTPHPPTEIGSMEISRTVGATTNH